MLRILLPFVVFALVVVVLDGLAAAWPSVIFAKLPLFGATVLWALWLGTRPR